MHMIITSLEENNLHRIKQWNLFYLMDWTDEELFNLKAIFVLDPQSSSNPFLWLTLDALQIKLNLFWCKFSVVIILDPRLGW
jgi:hypothetical protein